MKKSTVAPNESSAALAPRKPYRRPHLIRYGSLREVTRSVGMNGASDGGTGNMMKTQP